MDWTVDDSLYTRFKTSKLKCENISNSCYFGRYKKMPDPSQMIRLLRFRNVPSLGLGTQLNLNRNIVVKMGRVLQVRSK